MPENRCLLKLVVIFMS